MAGFSGMAVKTFKEPIRNGKENEETHTQPRDFEESCF
jgi:hypothetical protein